MLLEVPKPRADTYIKKKASKDSSMIVLKNSNFFSHNSKINDVFFEQM